MDRKSLYVNAVSITMSSVDCQMLLTNNIVSIDDNGKSAGTEAYDSINIIMSIQHAKLFLNSLESQINSYEDMFGKIDMSKIMQTQQALHQMP